MLVPVNFLLCFILCFGLLETRPIDAPKESNEIGNATRSVERVTREELMAFARYAMRFVATTMQNVRQSKNVEESLNKSLNKSVNKSVNNKPMLIITGKNNGTKDSQRVVSVIKFENLTFVTPKNFTESVVNNVDGIVSLPFEAVLTVTTRQQNETNDSSSPRQSVVPIPMRVYLGDTPPYYATVLSLDEPDNRKSSSATQRRIEVEVFKDMREPKVVDKAMKTAAKKRLVRIGEVLRSLGILQPGANETRTRPSKTPTPTPVIKLPKKKPRRTSGLRNTKNKRVKVSRIRGNSTFQRQEIDEDEDKDEEENDEADDDVDAGEKDDDREKDKEDETEDDEDEDEDEDDDDDEEEEGSLGSITDVLPLVIPILEELSDPNSDTDLGQVLEVGVPLLQDLLMGDEDTGPIDVVGTLSPIFASLSGPNGEGLTTIIQAVLPLVSPLIGPLLVPLIRPLVQGVRNPGGEDGSSIIPLIQALVGPLSRPTEPGGVSPVSSLIAGFVSALIKDLSTKGPNGSDFGAVVGTLVSGVLAGGSAGLKGAINAHPKFRPTPRPGYGVIQGPVPASSVDTYQLVSTSAKDILGMTLRLVKSVVSSITGILGSAWAGKPREDIGAA